MSVRQDAPPSLVGSEGVSVQGRPETVGALSRVPVGLPDVALLAMAHPATPVGGYPQELVRLYRSRDGYVVRETLLGPAHLARPPFVSTEVGGIDSAVPHLYGAAGTADGSLIVVALCPRNVCLNTAVGMSGPSFLYVSMDGGVTWTKLADFDIAWHPAGFVLGNGGDAPRQLLLERGEFENGAEVNRFMLFPSGETEVVASSNDGREGSRLLQLGRMGEIELLQLLAAGAPSLDEERGFRPTAQLADGRLLGEASFSADELLGGGAAQAVVPNTGAGQPGDVWPWPAVYDLEAGELRPVALPARALRVGQVFGASMGLMEGPFLRVVDVDSCLSLKASPDREAKETDCVAERVLLRDRGEEHQGGDGIIWRRVETPVRQGGWVDGRFLLSAERPEPLSVDRLVMPIEGACLPEVAALLPNAPREYRAGIHEGIDLYDGYVCAPGEKGNRGCGGGARDGDSSRQGFCGDDGGGGGGTLGEVTEEGIYGGGGPGSV